MPLYPLALPYYSSRIDLSDLKSNDKLLDEEEILAVKSRLQNEPDGHYSKKIFNRAEMKKNSYSIIKKNNKYFLIYKKTQHIWKSLSGDTTVKIVQNLDTGKLMRLKAYSDAHTAEILPIRPLTGEMEYLRNLYGEVKTLSRALPKKWVIEIPKVPEIIPPKMKTYLLTDLLPGTELSEFIQMGEHIYPLRCVEIAVKILENIKTIHGKGYILCDFNIHGIVYDNAANNVIFSDLPYLMKMDAEKKASQPICGMDIYIAPEIYDERALMGTLKKINIAGYLSTFIALKNSKAGDSKAQEKTVAFSRFKLSKTYLSLTDNQKSEMEICVGILLGLDKNHFAETLNKFDLFINDKKSYPHAYNEKTDVYSAAIILKILFNIPVPEYHASRLPVEDNKFYKVGSPKKVNPDASLANFLNTMAATDPEKRSTLDEAISFFKSYYTETLKASVLKIGILDSKDFNTLMSQKDQDKAYGRVFYHKAAFRKTLQLMDEICFISKSPLTGSQALSWKDKISYQRACARMGVMYNNDILVTPTPAAISEIHNYYDTHKNAAIKRNYIYFDLNQFSNNNDFIPDNDALTVVPNGIHQPLTNGIHPNGILPPEDKHEAGLQVTVVAAVPAVTPLADNRIRKVNYSEYFVKNRINVIEANLDKRFVTYSLEIKNCEINLNKKQFNDITLALQADLEWMGNDLRRHKKNISQEKKNLYEYRIEIIRQTHSILYNLHMDKGKGVSLIIASHLLNQLINKWELNETNSHKIFNYKPFKFFKPKPKVEALLDELKIVAPTLK